ncbi:MAG TPA: recombinase family protein [Candidatus Bathyarchaeia archaeon]|nr:recombinase family protein [Candidatus Bathyarchaeia archaeon]
MIEQIAQEEELASPIAFAYLRVSTRKQDEDNQRLQITRYAKEHGIEVVDWFVDKDVSGVKVPPLQREGFRDLYETLEGMLGDGNAPTHVVVYEISRLGRNLWEILEIIKQLEEKCPIVSTSPKEAFLQVEDRSMRSLLILILAWAAEREAAMTKQRTMEGLATAREKSRHSGTIPLGYRIDHNAKDCLRLGHDPHSCQVHGVLQLDDNGRAALDMIRNFKKAKPRNLRKLLPELTSRQAWALLSNVRKFGEGGQKKEEAATMGR